MPKWLKKMVLGLAGLAVLALGLMIVLLRATNLPGEEKTPAGIRRDTALYIKMRDGVEIAADVWLPRDYRAGQRFPVLVRATRYGRDGQFGWAFRLLVALKQTDPHGPGDEQTDYLNARHFVVMGVDARGSGASGGHRETEFSSEEISDLGELVNWAAQQPWSNGRVGTFGNSYEGAAAELTAATKATAIKGVAAFSSQLDYGKRVFPGGIYNEAFVQSWTEIVKKLDSSDVCVTEHLSGIRCWWAGRMLRGVKRVDDDRDGKQLAAIIVQRHNRYPADVLSGSEFRDDRMTSEGSAFGHRSEIESSQVAIQVWCGWLDATACDGALSRYLTFRNPQQVIIGAFSHELTSNTDPLLAADQRSSPDPTVEEQHRMMADFFDRLLRPEVAQPIGSGIRYHTIGERQWHETKVWPPAGFENRSRFYLSANHTLGSASPLAGLASDSYFVNFEATTGTDNRWFADLDHDIVYPDRSAEDKKLIVYDGAPLETDVEITGSPVVTLEIASTAADGAFFAYLEDVAPDGRVTFLDDGEIRALGRKLVDPRKLPYASLGPVSSGFRSAAQPLVPGKPAELKFSMWPTSIVLHKGHQIRIALAGADACFRRYPPVGDVTWTVYRQSKLASFVELPIRLR